jgi:hypothetical protein
MLRCTIYYLCFYKEEKIQSPEPRTEMGGFWLNGLSKTGFTWFYYKPVSIGLHNLENELKFARRPECP